VCVIHYCGNLLHFVQINHSDFDFQKYKNDVDLLKAYERLMLYPPKFKIEFTSKCTNATLRKILRIQIKGNDEDFTMVGEFPFQIGVIGKIMQL